MPLTPNDHAKFHYSIKCKTDDSAVLHCLRALCQWAQKGVNVRIGWGGTKLKEWQAAGNCATFRFTTQNYRNDFVSKAKELLAQRWEEIEKRDDDPATPQ
jgi:hypothetical protein